MYETATTWMGCFSLAFCNELYVPSFFCRRPFVSSPPKKSGKRERTQIPKQVLDTKREFKNSFVTSWKLTFTRVVFRADDVTGLCVWCCCCCCCCCCRRRRRRREREREREVRICLVLVLVILNVGNGWEKAKKTVGWCCIVAQTQTKTNKPHHLAIIPIATSSCTQTSCP